MTDKVVDDFLKRFGSPEMDTDFGRAGSGYKAGEALKIGASGIGADKSKNYQIGDSGVKVNPEMEVSTGTEEATGLLSKAGKVAGIAGEALGAVDDTMGLISNIKGGQFDTSAEGGGVGKAGGAIVQGAVQGANLGRTVGKMAGPVGEFIGMGVGAVGGGLVSTFAHKNAKEEYLDNRRNFNANQNALEKANREEEYRRAEGLAALENTKALRQKQLGLIS